MSAAIEPELLAPQTPVNTSRPKVYRDYSPEFKAEVLAAVNANAGNVLRTANEYSIDESVIRRWLPQAERYRQLSDQKIIDLAQKAENNAHLLADSIYNHDLDTASLSQKATAMGIMVDKMQLLRSQPTQITANVNIESLTITLQQVIAEITSTDSDS
jgi:transposase-like protein